MMAVVPALPNGDWTIHRMSEGIPRTLVIEPTEMAGFNRVSVPIDGFPAICLHRLPLWGVAWCGLTTPNMPVVGMVAHALRMAIICPCSQIPLADRR